MSNISAFLRALDISRDNPIAKALPNNPELLPGGDPIVFMPLRLETRFKDDNLLVRVFPDEIFSNQHKTGLSDSEIKAGEDYWKKRLEARRSPEIDYEQTKKTLWQNLANLFFPQRATWIILQTQPINWEENPPPSSLTFPEPNLLKNEKPSEHLLPSRLVLLMETDDGKVTAEFSNVIPPDLHLIPDFDNSEYFKTIEQKNGDVSETRFSLGDEIAWMGNFEAALDKGMAFELKLTNNTQHIKWLLVVGVRESLTPTEGSEKLHSLLESHYFSSKGLHLVPQGTPTNNSEEGRTIFEDRNLVRPDDYDLYNPDLDKRIESHNDPAFATDQQRLSERLGIPFEDSILRRVGPHRRAKQDLHQDGLADFRESRLMNSALYHATLGYYTENALNGVFGPSIGSSLRTFYLNHVSGRGPLPALRRGNQPYGWVLCGDVSNFSSTSNAPDEDKAIARFIRLLEREVSRLAHHALHIGQLFNAQGEKTPDTSEILEELMKIHPMSVQYFRRDLSKNSEIDESSGKLIEALWTLLAKQSLNNPDFENLLLLHLTGQRRKEHGAHAVCYPEEPVSEMHSIAEIDPDHQRKMHAPFMAAGPGPGLVNYIAGLLEWLSMGVENISNQPYVRDEPLPLLYYLLKSAVLHQTEKCVLLWLKHEGFTVNGRNIHDMDYLQIKMEVLYPNNATLQEEEKEMTIAQYILAMRSLKEYTQKHVTTEYGIGERNLYIHEIPNKYFFHMLEDEAKWKALREKLINNKPDNPNEALHTAYTDLLEMIKSLYVLAGMPTARLERCFAEHIDSMTYRADAWITGLLSSRLDAMRKGDAGVPKADGAFIGAYGWLLDIRRSAGQADGGYVHAPSLAQAATGALLKNGFKHYGANTGAFAVDLFSERVRKGIFLLEGLQEGFELSALLGYQFERALHDAQLDEYIPGIRSNNALNNKVFIKGDQQSGEGIVTDGLKIIKQDRDVLVRGIDSVHQKTIKGIADLLESSLDALSDILMAEAVHQYSNGNMERAGSILRALSEGSVPPSPEFIQTPRASKHVLTNRVAVVMKKNTPSTNANPRATLAPELNSWLAGKIGDLSKIHLKVFGKNELNQFVDYGEIKLSELNLDPLDLIYAVPAKLILASDTDKIPAGADQWGRRIVRRCKEADISINGSMVFVDYSFKPSGAGNFSFLEKYFLLLKLKELVGNARNLHGGDFSNQYNHAGYSLLVPSTQLEALKTKITGSIIGKVILADKYNALNIAAHYGFTEAFGTLDIPNFEVNTENSERIEKAYESTVKAVEGRVAEANNAMVGLESDPLEKKMEKLTGALKLLFNGTICPLPYFKFEAELADQIILVDQKRSELLKEAVDTAGVNNEDLMITDWLDGLHHVRPSVGTFRWVRLLTERQSTSQSKPMKIWQLPYVNDDRWLGARHKTPQFGNKISVVAEFDGDVNQLKGPNEFCGLVFDDWVETIPYPEETTGISLNYNKPNAEPPQALLLAIRSVLPSVGSPTSGWTLLEVIRAVMYALKLGAIRGVHPDELSQGRWNRFLPALVFETAKHKTIPVYFK